MRTTVTFCILVTSLMLAAEKRVKMNELPIPVQKAVEEQTKGSQVKGFSKEIENGKTFYEAETIVDGKTRDLLFDPNGVLVEVEEEVSLGSIPAPAKAAIEKRAGTAKIVKVEKVTSGKDVKYEATVKRGLKSSEIAVTSDGSPAK